jgi:DNA-binding MarR family transcriptional regulator
VRRQRDLDDRRAVRLELTDSGQDLADTVAKTLREHTHAVFSRVRPETKQQLRSELDEIEQSLQAVGEQ